MAKTKMHYRVNWQDGMKIKKDHFIAADNYHVEQGNMTRSMWLNEYSFGLLPDSANLAPLFNLEVKRESNTLKLSKYALKAVMLNGMLVDIDSEIFTSHNIDTEDVFETFELGDNPAGSYALILRFDAFEVQPYGTVNSSSLPLLRPFLLPKPQLIIEPASNVKKSFFGEDFFILAYLQIDKNDVCIDSNYIPPVTSLLASKTLTDYLQDFYEKIRLIETYNLEIAKKYSKLGKGNLNETFLYVSTNLMPVFSALKISAKHELLYETPLKLIIKVKNLANIFYQSLEVRTGIGKDNYLNEVNKVLGTSKKDFDFLLKNIMKLEYKHYDIASAFNQIKKFIDDFYKLFKSLSESDKQRLIPDYTVKRKRI